MFPEYPQFKPLAIDDLPEILKYINVYSPTICELNPRNFVIWQDFDHPQLTLINGNLCVLFGAINRECFFLEPVGSQAISETTKTCLAHCKTISRLSEKFIRSIAVSAYKVKCLRSQFDYICSIKKMAELKGRNFDGKRNHIKNFKKRYPSYEFAPLTENDQSSALVLFEKWFGPKKETAPIPQLAYSSQNNALSRAFANYNVLGLIGAKLTTDGQMIGFIIGSQLNANTVNAHFQYTDPDYKGASQTLLQEACRQTFNHYEFINLEQDLGIPGLRKSKLSYHPVKLEKKYEITLSLRHA